MAQLNTIGVDLAKNVIQVSVLTPQGKEFQNKALTRTKFKEFLVNHQRSLVAFEAVHQRTSGGGVHIQSGSRRSAFGSSAVNSRTILRCLFW